MNQMHRVLYVCGDRGLDLTKAEGYTIHVLRILEGLRKRGHKALLVTVNDHRRLEGFGEHICVPHRYARVVHRAIPYLGVVDSINVLRACCQAHKAARFDLVHERQGLHSYGGWWAAKLLDLPYVVEVNAPIIEEKGLSGPPLRGAERWSAQLSSTSCLRRADRIVAVSAGLKRYLADRWSLDEGIITVLPNAADTEAFGGDCGREEIRSSLGFSDRTVIGFVGTLHVWYGVENLLMAFNSVRRQVPDALLVVVGDGQARQSLEQLSAQLGLGDAIRFLGNVEHGVVPGLLSAMDVAVAPFRALPTGFYASALKVFEYMAAGKAIVASRIGQIAEVLRHEQTALLVEPGDVQELSTAIVRLAKDAALRARIGAAARREAERKYSWDGHADRLVALYLGLIRGRRQR